MAPGAILLFSVLAGVASAAERQTVERVLSAAGIDRSRLSDLAKLPLAQADAEINRTVLPLVWTLPVNDLLDEALAGQADPVAQGAALRTLEYRIDSAWDAPDALLDRLSVLQGDPKLPAYVRCRSIILLAKLLDDDALSAAASSQKVYSFAGSSVEHVRERLLNREQEVATRRTRIGAVRDSFVSSLAV
jgi:hypothetical protein